MPLVFCFFLLAICGVVWTAGKFPDLNTPRHKTYPIPENGSIVVESSVPPTADQVRVTLINGLRQNSQMIQLGRGFYYINKEGEDALDSIASFMHENTNITPCIIFSAKSNTEGSYTWGHVTVDLTKIPKDLGLINGTFVGFVGK
jgi:hypothetical protein